MQKTPSIPAKMLVEQNVSRMCFAQMVFLLHQFFFVCSEIRAENKCRKNYTPQQSEKKKTVVFPLAKDDVLTSRLVYRKEKYANSDIIRP
jgi:hypothetical protein